MVCILTVQYWVPPSPPSLPTGSGSNLTFFAASWFVFVALYVLVFTQGSNLSYDLSDFDIIQC